MRNLMLSIVLGLGLAGMAAPSVAAPCKDAKGKFIKCPPAKKAPVRCKDGRGKFVKCGMPGAKPI